MLNYNNRSRNRLSSLIMVSFYILSFLQLLSVSASPCSSRNSKNKQPVMLFNYNSNRNDFMIPKPNLVDDSEVYTDQCYFIRGDVKRVFGVIGGAEETNKHRRSDLLVKVAKIYSCKPFFIFSSFCYCCIS